MDCGVTCMKNKNKNNEDSADSIALSIELGLFGDKDGSYRAKIIEKLDKFEEDAKAGIKKGANPKEFAKLSKLLQAVPAAKEILELYAPINK